MHKTQSVPECNNGQWCNNALRHHDNCNKIKGLAVLSTLFVNKLRPLYPMSSSGSSLNAQYIRQDKRCSWSLRISKADSLLNTHIKGGELSCRAVASLDATLTLNGIFRRWICITMAVEPLGGYLYCWRHGNTLCLRRDRAKWNRNTVKRALVLF